MTEFLYSMNNCPPHPSKKKKKKKKKGVGIVVFSSSLFSMIYIIQFSWLKLVNGIASIYKPKHTRKHFINIERPMMWRWIDLNLYPRNICVICYLFRLCYKILKAGAFFDGYLKRVVFSAFVFRHELVIKQSLIFWFG